MDKLFTPGKIGKLTIKNRAVLAPMQMMYGEHLGYAGERLSPIMKSVPGAAWA